jgi:hypothetical protein
LDCVNHEKKRCALPQAVVGAGTWTLSFVSKQMLVNRRGTG